MKTFFPLRSTSRMESLLEMEAGICVESVSWGCDESMGGEERGVLTVSSEL